MPLISKKRLAHPPPPQRHPPQRVTSILGTDTPLSDHLADEPKEERRRAGCAAVGSVCANGSFDADIRTPRDGAYKKNSREGIIVKDEEVEARIKRLMEFKARHPELDDVLDLWFADPDTCRELYPEAVVIFERELAGL